MTEKELQKGWWWLTDEAWLKIARQLGARFAAGAKEKEIIELCKIEYERCAFLYEVRARGPKPRMPHYPFGVPFHELPGKKISDWRKKYLSQAWQNGGGMGSRLAHIEMADGVISLDGITVNPGQTTRGHFQRAVLEHVQRLMHERGIKWGKAESFRAKPWPWDHLENSDRLVNGLPLKSLRGTVHVKKVVEGTLREYGGK